MYLGMNAETGKKLPDIGHIKQSIKDILNTPIGSRIARRDYGSLLFRLMDQPQNPVTQLKMMSAIYSALAKWEPRIKLTALNIETSFNGQMIVSFEGRRTDTDTNVNFELPIGLYS